MWRHAWRDVRWKLALMAIVNTAISALFLDDAVAGGVWIRRLSTTMPMLFAMNAIVLANAGVATQVSQRPGQVVHSSMLFLLSLPLSRKRLVLVREATGMVAALSLMLLTLGAYWLLSDATVWGDDGNASGMVGCRRRGVHAWRMVSAGLDRARSAVADVCGAWSDKRRVLGNSRRAILGTRISAGGRVRAMPGITACVPLAPCSCARSVRMERKQF